MKYVSATHDKKLLTVEYVAEDGTRYLRSGGKICWRFFNPGNIRPSKTSVCNPFKIGVGDTKSGEFMIFPSEEVGWKALKLLLNSVVYKNMEIKNVAKKFAPEKDKNDPEKYSKFIVKESGLDGDRHVKDLDEASLERLMEAIKKMEGYYNAKDTRREKIIPTTTVVVSDGSKPIANEKFKVVIDQCIYEWNTNEYGELPVIAHLANRGKVDILAANTRGVDEKIYTSTVGSTSKNILLLRGGSSYTAKTGAHKEGEKSTSIYHVKKGDTLSKIAKKLHTTVKRIADLNKIQNVNILSVGQELKIPDGIALPQTVPSPASNSSRGNQRQTSTGSSDAGYPQANIRVGDNQAPWMDIAIREAKLWGGENAKNIKNNYHKNIGLNGGLDNTPWCASFVNYCLKESGVNYVKSASSQFPVNSRLFKEISEPVYGAIMVLRTYSHETKKSLGGRGHVTFVYGRTKNGGIAALGGNQGNSIKLSSYSESGVSVTYYSPSLKTKVDVVFYKYYVPITYYESVVNNITTLQIVDIDEINKNWANIQEVSGSNESVG